MFDAGFHAGFNQVAGFRSIVLVIPQWFLHGFRDNRGTGEMHDRRHPPFTQQQGQQVLVARVAFNQLAVRDRRGKPFGQVVQNDDLVAFLQQVRGHMAADITGAAGQQDRLIAHDDVSSNNPFLRRSRSLRGRTPAYNMRGHA